jgi:hypothetical protein
MFAADPLPSYLGCGVNDTRNGEVRAILEPFVKQIIQPRDVMMFANSHLNKNTDAKSPAHRILGSVAYANLARNVHFVFRDPGDHDRRLVKQIKSNNAPDGLPAIAFRIEQRELVSRDGEVIETVTPVWDGTVEIDAADVLASGAKDARRGPEPSRKLEIALWLLNQLRDASGNREAVCQLIEEAGDKGFLGKRENGRWKSLTMLYKARDHIAGLPEPDNGWAVEEQEIESTVRRATSGPRKFWHLIRTHQTGEPVNW